MPSNKVCCASLLLAVLISVVVCADDQRPSDFSFTPGEEDAGEDIGADVGFDGPTTYLQLFHNAPDSSLATVDMYARVQDETILVADDLEFRKYTSYLAVPAGVPWDLVVASPDSDDDGALQSSEVLEAADDIELSADTRNLAIAHGLPDSTGSQLPAFDVAVRKDLFTTPAEDAVNGLFFHGSAGLPAVDMSPSNAYPVWTVFNDIAYGAFSEENESFSQPDVFEMYTNNGVFVTNFQPPLGVEPTFGGGVLTGTTSGRLARGGNDTPGFRLAVFSNNPSVVDTTEFVDLPVRSAESATLLRAGARVRFIHAASAPGFETVDLEIGSEPENVSDLSFSEASDFYSLPSGTDITVDVAGTDSSFQRTFSVQRADSGFPPTRAVFISGNGQNQEVQLRTVSAQETTRYRYRNGDRDGFGFTLFHALTTESFSAVDVSFLNTSGDVLRGPVTLDYGNAFSGSVDPATELAKLRVSLGGTNFEFDLSPIDEGTYATLYLADAPTALGISAYALVDAQDPVELPRE